MITIAYNQLFLSSNRANSDSYLEQCKTCVASNPKRKPKLMLTNVTKKNVDPFYLCSFTETTMKALGSFKPNIMGIHCSPELDKFISFWINIMSALKIKRAFLNHLEGALIQTYAVLMVQQISKDKSANIEALSKLLTLCQEGKLDEILNESYDKP